MYLVYGPESHPAYTKIQHCIPSCQDHFTSIYSFWLTYINQIVLP